MSVDFPRAWELVKKTSLTIHNECCSYRQTNRALLCDCEILMKHPEVTDDVLQTRGGVSVTTEPEITAHYDSV